MKESYWGYWLVLLGIFVVVVMLLANDATTTNTKDYYQLKEVANSALYDSIDYAYYSETQQVRILKEVFVENFLRRFAETVGSTDTYKVQFYDLYESPPKVSIKISTTTDGFIVGRDAANAEGTDDGITNLDVVNSIDLLVEFSGSGRTCTGSLTCNDDPSLTRFCNYYDTGASNFTNGSSTFGSGSSSGGGSTSTSGTSTSGGTTLPSGTSTGGGTTSGGGTSTGGGTTPSGTGVAGAIAAVEENLVCTDGDYDEFDASGLKAYSMGAVNVREGDGSGTRLLKTMTGGEEVTVVGKSKTSKYWRVQYEGDKCGWVHSQYMAVNLQTYLPKNGATGVGFRITNSSSSIYYADDAHTRICHSNGKCIDGQRYYSGDYKPIAVYAFASKLKDAALDLQRAGRRLVIVDAYRPAGVTTFLRDVYSDYLTVNKNTQYAKDIKAFGQSWFLASNYSNHNFACAVDVEITGEEMPTNVHVLNVLAAKANYKKGATNANSLETVMANHGLTTIKSEWWHYQLPTSQCDSIIKQVAPNGANFWNNGYV